MALGHFNGLHDSVKLKFFNLFQEIFNSIGVIKNQKGCFDRSIPYLLKAEQIYKMVKIESGHNTSLTQDLD